MITFSRIDTGEAGIVYGTSDLYKLELETIRTTRRFKIPNAMLIHGRSLRNRYRDLAGGLAGAIAS